MPKKVLPISGNDALRVTRHAAREPRLRCVFCC